MARGRLLAFGTILAMGQFLRCGEALAHASDRGHVLLLPTGHYLVGGALAVAASFAVLLAVPADLGARLARLRLPLCTVSPALRLPVSLCSFAVVAILVAAGFLGSRDPLSNPLPLVAWTLFWAGLTLMQGVFGNVWRWINPWYGPWRVVSAVLGATVPRGKLPDWLGMWPAGALFLGFAWFELIYPAPDDPYRLALAVASYGCFTLAAMLLFGYEAWSRRGEFLTVFFRMIGRFGLVEGVSDPAGKQRISFCLPGAKLADAPVLSASGTLFLLMALGSVSFDGLSKTFLWLSANGINPLEYPGRTALESINSAGLAATVAALAACYCLCVFLGERLAKSQEPFWRAAGLFVWSIVPIALAYHFAHYLTAFMVNSQYALVALSDPFAKGWNLFGTAHMPVSAGVTMGSDAAWVIWNLQAGAIVGGHVLAVLAAHLLAFRLHGEGRKAMLSQAPLTLLMIAYTVFGLWLLSTPTAG